MLTWLSFEYDSRSGRPAPATSEENVDRVHHMVIDDRRLTRNQIANSISLYCEEFENILHNVLGMMKVCTR